MPPPHIAALLLVAYPVLFVVDLFFALGEALFGQAGEQE